MEKIKVLQLTTIDMTAYFFLLSWIKELQNNGFDVTVACTEGQFAGKIRAEGIELVNIPISRRLSPFQDFVSLLRLYKFIKKRGFHIVHSYTSKAGFIGRLAARLAGVPVIIHTIFDLPHNSTKNPLLKKLYILMEKLASQWASGFVTISTSNLEEIKKFAIAPLDKVSLIPVGINLNKYQIDADKQKIRRDLGIDESPDIAGIVGRLEPPKGHEFFLRAAKEILKDHPRTFFVIVGSGYLRESLEVFARELGIKDRVIFTGFRDDMIKIMSTFSVFVLPSLWEGQGVVICEAMAMKIPVVASKVGGITDVVNDGETGILVTPADYLTLARAIGDLLSDKDKRLKMGQAGYEKVKKEFLEESCNAKLKDFYGKMIEENDTLSKIYKKTV